MQIGAMKLVTFTSFFLCRKSKIPLTHSVVFIK